MDRPIDSGIEALNAAGRWFCSYAWSVSVQVSVLIVILLVLDVLLRRRVRAVVRYAMWMLVFVKLLLPPTLALPTGIGYYRPEHRIASQRQTEPVTEQTPPEMEQPSPVAEAQLVPREPVVVSPPAAAIAETPTPVVSRPDVISTPVTPAVVRPAFAWQGLVFLGWLTGVLMLSVYLLRRVQYVRKLVRYSTPASEAVASVLTDCGTRLGLRSCPPLHLSDDAPGPAVCGLFRPVILMPTSLSQTLDGERLRAVLVHELAHIRRADLWTNFVQTLLLVVYFFHPLLWLAHAIVRRLREQAVDETVLVALDAEARSYSTTLIDLAETAFHRPALGLRLIGIAESKKALEGRIRHMITRPKPRTAKLGLCGLLAIVVTAAVLLPMARGQTGTTKPRFVAKLPSGVTVELLGVCNWPTRESVCWKPDGSPLDPPLQAAKGNVKPSTHDYGFMLRVMGPDDRDMSWNKIEGAGGWEGSCDVLTADGKHLEDGTAAVADMEGPGQQTSLRIGIATGPWTTISTYDGKSSAARSGGVLWSRAFNDSGTACIVATAEWLKDRTTRIIAIDNSGATHTTPRGSIASNGMDQMTARFYNLRSDQIQEFQYQVRPYQWVQFENVSLRPRHATSVIVEPKATDAEMPGTGAAVAEPDRDYSQAQLSALGRMLLIYSVEHDDELPATLADVREYSDQRDDLALSWVQENVTYLGRGMTTSNEPDDPVAYDKTLLATGGGTNVLHLDTSVTFESPERLEEVGIGPDKPSPARLRESTRRMRNLARNLLIYANDHGDTFPDALEDLPLDEASDPAQRGMEQELAKIYGNRYVGRMGARPGRMDARQLTWYRENVQYLGKGVKATGDPARVLAYDKTLLAEGKGTNVLTLDSRVKFVGPEQFKEPGVATTRESLPDIFIMSPSNPGFSVFDAILSRTRDWTWNKTGRHHSKEAYDKIFDGTDHRTSHDILVLVFTWPADDRIPAAYEDLLPIPWPDMEHELRVGRTVERSKEVRGLHVILLAAPRGKPIKQLIAESRLIADSKEIARSSVTGCDVAIEDFKVHLDPDLGTFSATVSIRNKGVATCPKIVVYFYRGDPKIATPMANGAGPIEPGKTWNEVSSQFALREGDNEVSVVLDPGDLVQELDEINNRATLRVVVRNGRIVGQIDLARRAKDTSSQALDQSYEQLMDSNRGLSPAVVQEAQQKLEMLGKALMDYGQQHGEMLPNTLDALRDSFDEGTFQWLAEHVEYLGRGRTLACPFDTLIAYEKTMLERADATVALCFGDHAYSAMLRSRSHLRIENAARNAVLDNLRLFRLIARSYAAENDLKYADDLDELGAYVAKHDGTLWRWVSDNVEYLGKGARLTNAPPGHMPFAYCRPASEASDEVAVVFWDGRAHFVKRSEFGTLVGKAKPASEGDSEMRLESQMRLKDLGKALLIYANDHDDKLPDALVDIHREFGVGFSWLTEHVAYLGRGMTVANNPKRPTAFDKTLIQSGAGTNVLYLDTQVVFESPKRLEELGIRYEPKPKSAEEIRQEAERQTRVTVLSHLKQLALAAILYADEQGNTAANNLADLKPYIGNDALFTWAKENAQYVGRGAVRGQGSEAFQTPVFYWKNPPATMDGTAVAFWDGHVEIVDSARLDDLGIKIQPSND